MVRLLLTVFLVIVASFIYGYFRELNPGEISIRTSPTSSFDLSPVSLVLLSMATGALIVTVLVGVRETKHLIANWRHSRRSSLSVICSNCAGTGWLPVATPSRPRSYTETSSQKTRGSDRARRGWLSSSSTGSTRVAGGPPPTLRTSTSQPIGPWRASPGEVSISGPLSAWLS